MNKPRTRRASSGLPAEITDAFVALWTAYAGEPPREARTEIRGNVITCVLVDAVGAFDGRIGASQADDSVMDADKLSSADYKSEAVATVVRLTRQRVRSFLSNHDGATDVATEIFTLEPSLSQGRPRLAGVASRISPGLLKRVRQARRGAR